jgi:hypothetical protein
MHLLKIVFSNCSTVAIMASLSAPTILLKPWPWLYLFRLVSGCNVILIEKIRLLLKPVGIRKDEAGVLNEFDYFEIHPLGQYFDTSDVSSQWPINVAVQFSLSLRCSSVTISRIEPSSRLYERKFATQFMGH